MHTAAQAVMATHNAAVSTGIFDTINNLTSQTNSALHGIAILVATVMVIKSSTGRSWGFFFMMTALAVVAVWVVAYNGLSTLASMLNGDLTAAGVMLPATSSVLIG